ncbi:ATP-binding protein [Streptomyces sp. NBC_00690]|uniref:ATP-binding protein n=1 Tax=Streptomyces sp. NBC_00690 TaxID=2975808 RepID=UPI002E2D0CD9|nr:ATP-binding protein [Streptomyces sp. NBC_00690]
MRQKQQKIFPSSGKIGRLAALEGELLRGMQEARRGRPLKKLDPELKPEIAAWAIRLREFYTILNMTLVELEQHLGVTPATLSRYLNGERLPEIAFLARLDAAVESKTGRALRPEVVCSVREQYYAACAVREPRRHQVYVLQDALKEAEGRATEAERTVWELRTELQAEKKLRGAAETSLRALREHADRATEIGAVHKELEEAAAERDRLGALVQLHLEELAHALKTQQLIEDARVRTEFALRKAELELEAELERHWTAVQAVRTNRTSSDPGPARGWWRRSRPKPGGGPQEERRAGGRGRPAPVEPAVSEPDPPDARELMNDLFVNLSRRNQLLIKRQLSLISTLESREVDPDQLSSLFTLDHLATRIRRNGENLLVLAGAEAGREMVGPVPLVDVLKDAASAIEEYERIELESVPVAEVTGRAVNDLVHLFGELLENATSFSSPQYRVKVTGHDLPDGRLLVQIQDKGVGLSPGDLGEINDRLASPPTVDVSVSRRLGLLVVGRLSVRHGTRVQLRPGDSGGTIALVMLPGHALEGREGFMTAPPFVPGPHGQGRRTRQKPREGL